MHAFLFSEFISQKITFQLPEMFFFFFSRIHLPKIIYHVFVCDSENYMEKCLGIIFVENLISEIFSYMNSCFGINFAIISAGV